MVVDMLILGVYGVRKQVCDLNLMADLIILMKGLRKKKNCCDNFGDFRRYRKGFRLFRRLRKSILFFLFNLIKIIPKKDLREGYVIFDDPQLIPYLFPGLAKVLKKFKSLNFKNFRFVKF